VVDADIMTVLSVSAGGGIYDTLVPAVGVLVALNVAFGAVTVALLRRASSATVA